ncbi:peptide ABC transporter substrate-binding protein [Amedibacillus dolichus]|uniref:Peptide ABC transporter substrate-binding protein n=1 Tax=Amedibacillus dolichus TaxID=31971 RepID=A0ABT7UAX2_9FIRM|nr:peptide ABC transporter substrate-binding protein [Amedibacillus dolichus]MDM8156783.1 peptide ABC transporter substrate-binding protein [Amedibacillus dolichus]
MKKILASTAALAMVATTLTGCGGSGDITAESGKTNLTVAVGGDFALPDPAIVDDSITANVLAQCYDGLYKLDKDGNVVANLAEDLPTISEDGLTYTIKLKDGLTWSDGTPLTAEDFVWSWKRAMTTEGYYTNFMYGYIAGTTGEDGNPYTNMEDLDANMGVRAVDDTTIEITLKMAAPYFTSMLTNTVFYPVKQDEVGSDPSSSEWAQNASADDPIVTNGAFEITGVNIKDAITLSKSENYSDADNVQLETIEFKVMGDLDSQTQAFISGEVDFATAVNVEQINNDEQLQGHVYAVDPFVCNYFVLVNAGNENDGSTDGLAALKDVEIRQAISMAIGRTTARNAFGYGDDYSYDLYALIPSGIPDAEGNDFYEQGGHLIEDDVEAAKAIMESKGYSEDNMLTLTYKYNNLATHKAVAEAMQASLREIYIDLQLSGSEKEAFFNDRDAGNFELARHAMTADYLDPMCYLSMYVGSTTSGNTVDDPEFEQMVNEANLLSGQERMEKLHEAEAYLIEQGYIIPLFGYTEPFLKVKNLTGITSSPEGHYDLTHAYFE